MPATARAARSALPGPQGGVLPGRLRARSRRCSPSSDSTSRADRGRPHAPGGSLYHRFENDLFARCSAGRRRVAARRAAPDDEQRAELCRSGGFIVPARGDRRPVADRLLRSRRVRRAGTMNREAVALGTPVDTCSRGVSGPSTSASSPRGACAGCGRRRAAAVVRDGRGAAGPRPERGTLGSDGARACAEIPELLVDLLLTALDRRGLSAGRAAGPAPVPPVIAPTIRPMRRRIRSAAFPLHRHSLPQLAGGWRAGRPRLLARVPAEVEHGPPAIRTAARTHDLVGAALASSCSSARACTSVAGRYAGQRDYEAIVKALSRLTVLTSSPIAILRPVQRYPAPHERHRRVKSRSRTA